MNAECTNMYIKRHSFIKSDLYNMFFYVLTEKRKAFYSFMIFDICFSSFSADTDCVSVNSPQNKTDFILSKCCNTEIVRHNRRPFFSFHPNHSM